jgi:hypothetical protein
MPFLSLSLVFVSEQLWNQVEILESGTFTFNRIFEIFAHILKLHYNLSTGKTFANTNGIKILKSKFNFG